MSAHSMNTRIPRRCQLQLLVNNKLLFIMKENL